MREFWKGRRVLVTGSDGFIGSHLCEELGRQGAQVRAFVYYNSFGHWGWLDHSDPAQVAKMEIVNGDIRDASRVAEAVDGCDTVFHLASLIGIPYSYSAPDSYVQTNIGGALNILNAARKAKTIRRIVHTSTSEVYGTALYAPIDEKHPLQGQSPYSASKIGADMMAESYHRSFGLPVTIARPFNTYGPRQSARAVIPTILSQLHRGASEIKLGSVTPTRDFNYVQDTVTGFLAMAESENTIGKTLNIGSGREISIGALVEMLIQITGKKAKIVTENERLRPEKSEVERLLCESSELRAATGWAPATPLEKGLQLTSEWVKAHPEQFEKRAYQV